MVEMQDNEDSFLGECITRVQGKEMCVQEKTEDVIEIIRMRGHLGVDKGKTRQGGMKLGNDVQLQGIRNKINSYAGWSILRAG